MPASVCRPETTSTSFISGTGLKKCMPTRRPGCFRPLASAVIEIDEVFEASTPPSPTIASRSRKSARLASAFSTIASTTRPAAGRVVEPRRRADPAGDGLGFSAVELALGGEAVERRRQLRARGLRGAVARVEQPHRMSGLRRHLGDAGAHDSGADDEHGGVWTQIERHGALAVMRGGAPRVRSAGA
jgi:hypothetical protein